MRKHDIWSGMPYIKRGEKIMSPMAKPCKNPEINWYVIYTKSGKEEIVLNYFSILTKSYQELFLLWYEHAWREGGVWCKKEKIVYPGYIFVVATESQIMRLQFEIKKIPELTKILKDVSGKAIPLWPDEVAFLEKSSKKIQDGKRVIEMSHGSIHGKKLNIIDGPLVGQENRIKKIDRHKRIAYIETPGWVLKKEIALGLEIPEKN